MLKYNEHRTEQRSAEANAKQAWLERCRKNQEKQNRRKIEAARCARHRRLVISATEHILSVETNEI